MTAPATHTVHVSSVTAGLPDAVSRKLPGTTVVNARTHGFGLHGKLLEKYIRQLTEEEVDNLAEAEILLIDVPALAQVIRRKGLNHFKKLRWVHCTAFGVEALLDATDSKPPFMLTRSTDDISPPLIAEYVVGQILCHERCWRHIYQRQVNKDCKGWTLFQEYRGLAQLTVGVMGVGNMGLATAKALKGFGCRIHGLARVPRSNASAVSCVDRMWYGRENLAAFLNECDYVVNTLPSTPGTLGLLGGDVFSRATRRPVLVNVGRGDIISEADLLKALEQGWISGALLDCLEKEPPSEDSPLWTHPKVVITPHVSTIGSNSYRRDALANNFCANFAKFLAGQPLDGQVDWQAGY